MNFLKNKLYLWCISIHYRFFLLVLLLIIIQCKIVASSNNDTIVISFAPSNCKNCIIDLQFIDSILKSNNYVLKYYLYGLRKNETNYYLQNEVKFIKKEDVINKSSFFDSLFLRHLNNLFIKKNNSVIECSEFTDYYASLCKIYFDESHFPLNNHGRFKPYKDNLIYFEGDVFNKLAIFNWISGKIIKEINFTTDSLIFDCYKQVYKNNYKYTFDKRIDLLNSEAFTVNKEITLRNVEVYNDFIYVFCSIRIFQISENRLRPYDLIIKLNNSYDVVDYFISKDRKYKDDIASTFFSFENFSMQSDSTVIRPIYSINPNEQNKFNVLGLFRFTNHEIFMDSVIRINSTFLKKKSPNSFYMLLFSNTFYFNNKLYFNCSPFPYIYEYSTGKEFKLFSKVDLDEIDNYDEATLNWPFYVLKLEGVGNYLYEYSREGNKIQLTIFDKNFVEMKKIKLDLIDRELTKKDIIEIIHTDNYKIQYIVFTEEESYYKEYFLNLDQN